MSATIDPAILHRIEFEAGQSNSIVLSLEEAALVKLMIQETEHKIGEMEAEMQCTKSRLERLRIAIAPHKTVPPEVLREIFRSTVIRTGRRYYPIDMTRGHYDPWNLRQVCSSWRSVTCLDPSLWNVVTFDHTELTMDSIDFWMGNIVHPGFPLSLDISSDTPASAQFPFEVLIKPYSSRISHLEIEAFEKFFTLPIDSFPNLESLELRMYKDCFIPSWRYPVFDSPPCFLGMKSLRSLKVTSGNQTLPLSQFETIPWDQLTSLKLESRSPHGQLQLSVALQILGQCRQLEECRLQPVAIEGDPPVNHISIHLPRLTALSINEICNKDISLLDFITAPSLTGLRLDRKYISATSIAYLVHRSGCALHKLYISRSVMNAQINQLTGPNFEALSSLRILRARSVVLSNKTIEGIANGVFLPNIESLLFSCEEQGSVQSLANLVERRSLDNHLPPIRSISIDIRKGLSGDSREDVIDCLQRVKACGVRMTVLGSSFRLSSQKDV